MRLIDSFKGTVREFRQYLEGQKIALEVSEYVNRAGTEKPQDR